ncbi:2OG-Fe dioxygenase family protein [Streptomyces sp. PKU-EA00015]|uniref:2OG-Fe dioxygenase family protein n=1 Tax=Streptomyces sp. PKU-EA00015 TaxID=2748326 RepID=UPI0015A4AAC8|nr:2OG-Fe dioxygenase family protein [Streptomyces sp. PKU-EA00015]NWF30205.1 2OG-Fe dioxygenase family protein [Streptomyces sp. PKU-EA00015]
MITAKLTSDVALAAIKDLSDSGAHLIRHDEFSALTGVRPADWARFAENWEVLRRDPYMADGGTYRYRRYGQFELDMETGDLTQLPHGPYRQEADVNKLHGGVDRVYEPLTEAFVGDPVLRDVLVGLAEIFTGVDGTKKWNIKVTPIRTTATKDEAGEPTPEGRHKDGVTFITSLMIGRRNVTGGQSTVYADDGDPLVTTTLREPGDILLGDDRRTLHEVTAVHPEDDGEPGRRDVLIMAYTAR